MSIYRKLTEEERNQVGTEEYRQFFSDLMIADVSGKGIPAALNERPGAALQDVLKNVRRAVDVFVRDAEQFDDMTMLCLEYQGPPNEEKQSV